MISLPSSLIEPRVSVLMPFFLLIALYPDLPRPPDEALLHCRVHGGPAWPLTSVEDDVCVLHLFAFAFLGVPERSICKRVLEVPAQVPVFCVPFFLMTSPGRTVLPLYPSPLFQSSPHPSYDII